MRLLIIHRANSKLWEQKSDTMFISQLCGVLFFIFLAPQVRVTCQPWTLIVCFLCPNLFPKGFVCLCCFPSVSHAMHRKTSKLEKQWRNVFSAQYVLLCPVLLIQLYQVILRWRIYWYKLLHHPPRAEICHSFWVMPFDLSFSERNQVLSAFYLVVVRVRPGPWISTLYPVAYCFGT